MKKEYSETEIKIKTAAKSLFLEKGYSATTTRDISKESEINLALLNYYFTSKKKLFEIMNAQNLEKWEYLYQNEYLKNFIDMFTTYEDLVDIFYKIDISEFTEFIDRYENIQEKDMIEIEQWIRDKEMLINHKEDVARIYSYIDSITEEKTLEPIKNFIEKQEQEQSVVDI